MKNKAKVAGQARHSANTIAGLVAGIGLASTEQVEAVRTLLEAAGIGPELQVALGAAVLLVAHIASWFSKAKRVGEGDNE